MQESREMTVARRAAEAAAEVIRHYYRGAFDVQIKADSSPVTEADIKAEERIRSILMDAFPGYGFYGEESGQHQADADNLWLVDPLDGTKSFVRGYPFVSTQIALLREGKLHLGVSSAPLFDETTCAERGLGAWRDGVRLAVSDVNAIEQCTLSAGNIGTLASGPWWANYGAIVARVNRIRGYGDFYHYHLLAAGSIDVVIESDVNILDVAALSVIVEEAGGRFTDLEGAGLNLDTRSVLASNGRLQQSVFDALYAQ